ncbi:MAG: hypothetical protein QM703_15755 [Gemmatales bacterium]
MKLYKPSPVTRQLIIFGLIVALLWYGSGPVIGPDGRIVCCSADYKAFTLFVPTQKTDTFPDTIDIVEIAYGNRGIALINLPVTHKYWSAPSRFWQTAIEYFPPLNQIPRIRSKAQGGWVFWFSITPEQLEQLSKVDGTLMFQ